MLIRTVALVALILYAGVSSAERVLYCLPEESSGIVYRNGIFTSTPMKLTRFTVKISDDWKTLSSNFSLTHTINLDCKRRTLTVYRCGDHDKLIMINKDTLNFQYVHFSPFLHVYTSESNPDLRDTNQITVGKCEGF